MFGNIENGLVVSFNSIQSNVEHIYVCATVDINENFYIDMENIAVFKSGASVEDVEESDATPTTIGGETSIDLSLNEIYALDELAKDIEGNIYKTIALDDQEWFSENLKTTKFRNCDNIPTDHNSDEWVALINTEDGKGNPAYAMNLEALSEDQLLYNWFAVTDSHGLAAER